MNVPSLTPAHREMIDKLLARLDNPEFDEDWIPDAVFLLRILRDASLEVTMVGGAGK